MTISRDDSDAAIGPAQSRDSGHSTTERKPATSAKASYGHNKPADGSTEPSVAKRDYVRRRKGTPTGGHTCHWPGCTKTVPPAMWGCYPHWMTLPKRLRDKIWAAYQPGQEVSKTPSRLYVQVAQEVQAWITAYLAKARP